MFDTSIANPTQLDQWGKMVAAYVVAQSNGKAVIQDFSLPVFPILYVFDKSFEAAIKQWCPDCKVTEHPQQGSDIGTATPQAVVSAVTRAPSTNWLIFDLGDLATGVNAALSAAGLHGLHIGGLTADTPNIAGAEEQDAGRLDGLLAADRRVPPGRFHGSQVRGHGDPQRGAADAAAHPGQRQLHGGGLGQNYVGVANYRSSVQEALARQRLAPKVGKLAGGRPGWGGLHRLRREEAEVLRASDRG